MRGQVRLGVVLALFALVVPSDWRALDGTGAGSTSVPTTPKVWSFGGHVAVRSGDHRRVVLRSAELVGVRGLHQLGAVAYGPDRRVMYVTAEYGFPPLHFGDGHPVDGMVVGDRYTLLAFGATGVGSARGFAVTYEIDGRRYRQAFDTAFDICPYPPPSTSLNPASYEACRNSLP